MRKAWNKIKSALEQKPSETSEYVRGGGTVKLEKFVNRNKPDNSKIHCNGIDVLKLTGLTQKKWWFRVGRSGNRCNDKDRCIEIDEREFAGATLMAIILHEIEHALGDDSRGDRSDYERIPKELERVQREIILSNAAHSFRQHPLYPAYEKLSRELATLVARNESQVWIAAFRHWKQLADASGYDVRRDFANAEAFLNTILKSYRAYRTSIKKDFRRDDPTNESFFQYVDDLFAGHEGEIRKTAEEYWRM